MEPIAKITFEDDLYMEYSFTPNLESIGRASNTMSLFKDGDEGHIQWEYFMLNDDNSYDEVIIGLWFEDDRVVDYDGVFSLPSQAIKLLVDSGFNTDDVE